MNKSFKVVFSKARSALMVVNEATSSIQAKGTKTVIAVAAAMVAGGAMAAATNYESVTINEGSSIVYTGATGNSYTTQILGTTATGVASNAADKTKPAAIADKTEVGTITSLAFSGGSVVVNASHGNAAAVVQDQVEMGSSATQIAGNISVNAYQGAGQNASLTLKNIGLKSGTIDFGIVAQDATNDKTAAADVTTGTATLSAGTVTLGATSDNVGNVGSQVVVKTVAGTDATITATGAGTSAAPSMNLVNVAVENAGKLTVSATTGDVVVGKDSTFVNTGVLTVTSAAASGKVDFAADYDGKTGILNIGANTVNITGNITGDYVKVGGSIQVGADGKVTPTTDKNTIGISGTTITIGKATSANGSVTKTGSLIVGNTLEIAGNFTNNTTVEAPATEVTAVSGTVTNGQYGTMALGDLTIKETKGLTLVNSNTSGAVTVGKLLLDGTLAVSSGALEINGTGSKIGKGLLNIADTGVVTLKGDLTNEAGVATGITFTGANAKLTIDGSLDNTKNGVIGGDATSGSIVVTGTLTNKNTVGAKDITVSGKLSNLKNTAATEGYTGKITAGTVTVKEGGVVKSALTDDTAGEYVVGKTVVNKGGTFITALNSKITAEKDSLTLYGEFSLDGGVLGTAADTPVTKFNLISGDTLTLNGDYTLDTVKEATGAKFNVGTDATKTGNVTVKTLTAVDAGSVVVNGTLAVTDSLTAATAGSVQVASGTLATSLKAMNLEANATTGDVAVITGKTQSAANGFLTLSQDAVLDLDVGGTKVSKAGAATIVGLARTLGGLIDLGAVELYKSASEAVKVTNGEIAATELEGFDNITTDTLKASRILGKDTIANTSSYGAVELSTDAPTAAATSAAGLTINDSVTLTLNGMGETAVNLVQYKNDKVAEVTFNGAASKLVTKGNGVIGEVKGGTTNGVLEVADKGLTVEGNVVAKDVIVGTTGTLTMGTVADATKAYSVNVANLTVDGTFAAAQNTVKIGGSIEVDGTATIKTLDISAATNAAVEGTLTVDTLTAAPVKTMKVGHFDSATNKDAAGTVSVANFSTAGTIDATRAYTDKDAWTAPAASVAVKTAVAGALIKADENAYIAVGTTDTTAAQKALTAAGYTLAKTVDTDTTDKVEVNSIDARTVNTAVYVDGGKTATTNAVAFGGSIDTTDSTTRDGGEGVKIAANTALVFDTATIDTTGTTALFAQDLNIADGAVVAANNLKIGDKILLTAGNLIAVNYNWEDNVEFKGDILSHADVTDKVLSVAMYDKADLKKGYGLDSGVAGFDASYSYFANANRGAATTTSAQFAEWLYTKSSSAAYGAYSDGDKDVNVEAIRAIANAAGALGATTGVQTMTMDAVNQMGETVQDRVSVLTQRAAGVNVWAAANGGNFQAKTLYDGAGYKSDIYSGVLGVDYQFACNAVLGAALTVGTADTDSKNTAFGTSTDSDLVGFSVYTSKTFADIIGVSADIGYLSASNDVTANGYGFGYKFSEDTDAFTVGIRGEVLTQAGPVKIVPHIGLRYTALSTDSFEAAYVTDVDDQAIFQMPVGVTVSGDFQTGDWTVAPKFDLSVVPTFGDKDAEMKLGVTGGTVTSDYGVRVIDSNPVQATLGVNATNGAWGFGLNYKLGVGSDDRMNNTFNVNVRYAF